MKDTQLYSQISHRRAPVDEVMRMVDRYRNRHRGWNVKHYPIPAGWRQYPAASYGAVYLEKAA